MEIILLDNVPKLGKLGDQVTVKAGYARNFLIPTSRAVYANAKNRAAFEEKRLELQEKLQASKRAAEALRTTIESLGQLTLTVRANRDEGKLFGSITARDIADALSFRDIMVNRTQIKLPSSSLRVLGSYEAQIVLSSEVSATLEIVLIPEVEA